MGRGAAILLTMRPHQWVKNAFVLAPLVFSRHLTDPSDAVRAGLAVLVFCALSGAVYAMNDVSDREQDRLDPIKCKRPVASGALSARSALLLSALLALLALPAAFLLSVPLGIVATIYLFNNLLYSYWLKRIAWLDVAMIAAGFLLRVLAGGYAISVPVSHWILICTGLLAALLGFGKRVHELQRDSAAPGERKKSRGSLKGYSLRSLTIMLWILAGVTSFAYSSYTLDPRTVAAFQTDKLFWTSPFCWFGIVRFLSLALWKPKLESPTDAMLRDPLFIGNLLLWGIAVVTIIYKWQ